MPLKIAFGAESCTGMKESNEDFFGLVTPEGELLAAKGIVAAIADGAGSGSNGRQAAEYAVLSVLSDYYDTPETWEVPHALGKLLASANRWLLAQGASHREFSSMASTLSLLVLRGNRYTVAHVGDTRIYRLREGEFSLLTRDHVWESNGKHVLKRAVGLDMNLVVDYEEGELKVGDIFLLASDGVWECLGSNRMKALLMAHPDPADAAGALIEAAVASDGEGNATAQVLRIDGLAEEALRDILMEGADLPVPPMLVPGQKIDGYEVIEVLQGCGRQYKVKDALNGRTLVLKTLKLEEALDREARRCLLVEEWFGKKIMSPHVTQAVSAGNRHFLYVLTAWHEGATLSEMIREKHHFTVAEAIQIGIKIGRALSTLHRHDIVHRDIRPENLHLGKDGKIRILGLGSAMNPSLGSLCSPRPGDPDYSAPELLLSGEAASIKSDLYAMGVTIYHLLTGKYPYGEGAREFVDPVKVARYRPDIPEWLENILLKSVARDPERRFEMPEEFLLEMEKGEDSAIQPPPKIPLAARHRHSAWKITAVVSMLVNFLLLYMDAVESVSLSSGAPW